MMAVVVAMDALQALPFSYLRFQKRPIRFATLKLLFIAFNIGLNVLYFVVLGKTSVFYVFAINLACTSLISLCFIPELFKIRWNFDGTLLKRILSYSWPILILGVAGILNQVADKIMFPLVYPDKAEANVQLGIYGGCVKIAMIMAMITQAFRYAYEPIVFAKAKDKDSTEYYAVAMKYFLIFTLLAFLCVMGYIDVLQLILGKGYREGMAVVPIVMVAEIMMGVYFNLSFWYKLIDKTIYEGDYVNGKRSGSGVFTYANGDKYTGQFENGDKQGTGTLVWSNGNAYVGQWKADKPNGRGKLTMKNGDVYDGQFKNGKIEGEGIARFADGSKFKGTFRDGKRNGTAIEEDKDGKRFEGSYVDDLRDGPFVEKDRNGNIVAKGTYTRGYRQEIKN